MSKSPSAHLRAYVRAPLPPRPAEAHEFLLGARREAVERGGTVGLRALEPAADLEVIDAWMHDHEVAQWWRLDRGRKAVGAYLLQQYRALHSSAWVAVLDGTPFAYVETYLPAQDSLARYYDAQPGDRGFHLLVGEPTLRGTQATQALGRLIVNGLLAEPGATRVLCEPNVKNERMLSWCARLGGTTLQELELPEKRAALIAWTTEHHA